VVSHVFAEKGSSEGDLAILSQFLNADEESRRIVENAVLARLESPRTKEEIDLGFRLYEHIGPAAWSYVAEVNRSARRRYDYCLLQRFYAAVNEKMATEKKERGLLEATSQLAFIVDRVKPEIANETTVDFEYDYATMNRNSSKGALSEAQGASQDVGALGAQQALAAGEIARSNKVLRGYVGSHSNELPKHMDLSGTYLENGTVFDPYQGVFPAIAKAFTSGAYLSHFGETELRGFLYDDPEFARVASTPDIIDRNRIPGCSKDAPGGCVFHTFRREAC
jgi:hypothetical protein